MASTMSRNSSSRSLMGFSVHQPAIGSPLQFFPAMGSKQLDELIDAYVPGPISILDKRATVSLEFFDHTIQTGELFKFFLVHPTSNTTSPASSSMQDSGYASSFATSPVMSESQWSQAPNTSYASSSQSKPRTSSRAAAGDFSHIPGMQIMTKDGRDVTNTASRGCKTKEQRDHAHLMRIIKACPSCKKKKIRCDPSHKRAGPTAAPSPESRVTKKTKKSASPPAPMMPAFETGMDLQLSSFDSTIFDSFAPAAEPMDSWDQFIKYDDDEFVDVAPYNYDFFFDPAGYFSPTASNSASVSPTQILTPGSPDLSQSRSPASATFVSSMVSHGGNLIDLGDGGQPSLPYLNPGGAEAGNNYVDFALYSPGSTCLDDDPALFKELAASPSLDYDGYQRDQRVSSRDRPISRGSRPDQVNVSPQDTVISSDVLPTDVFKSQLFPWNGVSLATEPGDGRYGQQSALGAMHSTQDGSVQNGIFSVAAPAHPAESCVPTSLTSPPDRRHPIPPREPGHTVPAGSRYDPRPFVIHGPTSTLRQDGVAQLTTNVALPTTERSTSAPTSSSRAVEQEASRTSHVVQHTTGSIRHQRRPWPYVSAKTAAAPSAVAVNVYAGEQRIVVSQLPENMQQDHTIGMHVRQQRAVVKRKWSTSSTGSLRDRHLSQYTTLPQGGLIKAVGLVGLSAVHVFTAARGWSPTDTVDIIVAACIAAVNMALLLTVLSLTRGLRPYSSKPARPYSTGRERSVSGWCIGQPLKSLVGFAAVLGQTSWPIRSQISDNTEATMSSSHTVLFLVAALKCLRQYSVSCVDRLEPFTQALSFTRRLPHGNINGIESKIRSSRIC